MDNLISFIILSRNLDHLQRQLDHFEKNTANLSRIEFLILLDSDEINAQKFIENEIKQRAFTIKYLLSSQETKSRRQAIEQLFAKANANTYFIQIMPDTTYYSTPQWDNILAKYVDFYPDGVYRLRLSSLKFLNEVSQHECTSLCDSFPVYTKKWLELTEGIGGSWRSDAYHQCIAYHLNLGPGGYFNYYRQGSLCRDIPVYDLAMEGLEMDTFHASLHSQHKHHLQEWRRLTSYKMQKRFSYLARRIYCYIWAYNHNISGFHLQDNKQEKKVVLRDANNVAVFEISYKLQPFLIFLQNLMRDISLKFKYKNLIKKIGIQQ